MILSKLETSEGTIELPIRATFVSLLPLAISITPTILVTSGLCFLVKTTLAPRPALLGALIGIQVSFAVSSVLWEVFEGVGLVSSLLWTIFGFIVATAISMMFLGGGDVKKDEVCVPCFLMLLPCALFFQLNNI